MNLKSFGDVGEDLYKQLVDFPQEIVLSVFDHVTSTFATELAKRDGLCDEDVFIKVRPYNINREVNLRELNPTGFAALV
jgi:hypothetical protein